MRFAFAYGLWSPLLVVMGMGSSRSWIEVGDDTVRVKMGWAFDAKIPRASISAAHPLDKRVLSVGVHGWAGRWLVNGASDRLVRLRIEPEIKARSVIPVRLNELTMSVDDRDGLIAALAA